VKRKVVSQHTDGKVGRKKSPKRMVSIRKE